METRLPSAGRLAGPGAQARVRRLRQRFTALSRPGRWPCRLASLGRLLLAAYWVACLGVIGVGLDRLYPQVRGAAFVRPAMTETTSSPPLAHGRTAPYGTCAAAHAAGAYDIPAGSSMSSAHQDGDGDGLACEPFR